MIQVFRFLRLSGSLRGASNSTAAVLRGLQHALRHALMGVDDLLDEIR